MAKISPRLDALVKARQSNAILDEVNRWIEDAQPSYEDFDSEDPSDAVGAHRRVPELVPRERVYRETDSGRTLDHGRLAQVLADEDPSEAGQDREEWRSRKTWRDSLDSWRGGNGAVSADSFRRLCVALNGDYLEGLATVGYYQHAVCIIDALARAPIDIFPSSKLYTARRLASIMGLRILAPRSDRFKKVRRARAAYMRPILDVRRDAVANAKNATIRYYDAAARFAFGAQDGVLPVSPRPSPRMAPHLRAIWSLFEEWQRADGDAWTIEDALTCACALFDAWLATRRDYSALCEAGVLAYVATE